MTLSQRTLAFGRSLMTALLGVDRLYRAESGDETGLVVLNMDTGGAYEPDSFGGYGDAEDRLEELSREAESLPEADRRIYYGQACSSTLAFLAWRAGDLGFREQLQGFLHVPASPASDAELDALGLQMRSLLNGMGIHGDLEAQCATWEERCRVPPEDVPGVLAELMDRAWDRTEERLLPIPAPKSDGMRVRGVSGVPYNARCDYLARTVELNVDPVFTLPGLKHLAIHEGYPGHYVQFKLRETGVRRGAAAPDALLSVVNTASSSVFEGIADAGLEMLDWIESDDDRLQALLNRYRAGLGTAAAWRLHALGWAEERVADWLRARALVGGEGWVRNRMAFIAAPSRAVLIWSYWWGERSVLPAWRATPQEERRSFLGFLHERMHSVDSVGMFGAGSGSSGET